MVNERTARCTRHPEKKQNLASGGARPKTKHGSSSTSDQSMALHKPVHHLPNDMPLKLFPQVGAAILCLAFVWPVTVQGGDTICVPAAGVPDAGQEPGRVAHASHSTQSRDGPPEATYPCEWCGDDSTDWPAGEFVVDASQYIRHRGVPRLRREVLPWVRDVLLPFATAPPTR